MNFAVRIVDQVPAGVDSITNMATISDDAANGADLVPGDNAATVSTGIDAAPDLMVQKSTQAVVPGSGETVTYEIDYLNQGTQGSTGVGLMETVPNFSVAAGSNPGWEADSIGSGAPCDGVPAGTSCFLDLGMLDAGMSGMATFEVVIESELPVGPQFLINDISIFDDATNGADLVPSDNSFTLSTEIAGSTLYEVPTMSGFGIALLVSIFSILGVVALRRLSIG